MLSPYSHNIYYLYLYRKHVFKTISANRTTGMEPLPSLQSKSHFFFSLVVFVPCFFLTSFCLIFTVGRRAEGRRGPQSQSLTCDCFLGFPPVKINKKEKSDFCKERAFPKLPLAKQPRFISVLNLKAFAESHARVIPGTNSPLSIPKHPFFPTHFFPKSTVPPSLMGYFPYSPKPVS